MARRLGSLFIVAGLVVSSVLLPLSHALPGDYQYSTKGISGDLMNWKSVASSADGTKLVAVTSANTSYNGGGTVYTSSDAGATWTERTSAGTHEWCALASSADGMKLVATATLRSDDAYDAIGGTVYTSSDAGATWTERTSAGTYCWNSVASSADGMKLVAAYSISYNEGAIFTSSDAGATWTERTSAGARQWNSVASSADGVKLAATASNLDYDTVEGSSSIYTSQDSGATWTEQASTRMARVNEWTSITSSSDGTKLAATKFSIDGYTEDLQPIYKSHVYTSSNSGVDWTERLVSEVESRWLSITSSSDGTKLAAATVVFNSDTNKYESYVYTSSDSGVTWVKQTGVELAFELVGISSSSDGSKLITAGRGGSIHTSSDSGNTWSQRTITGWRNWHQVAMSTDGTKLAAIVGDAYGGTIYNGIYLSSDSGATWTASTSAGYHDWSSVAMSADGVRLVAAMVQGSIYTSSDSGATWVERPSAGQHYWSSIISSPDGSKVTAIASDDYGGLGFIYTSTDFGVTWTQRTSAGQRNWQAVTSSTDGKKIAATAVNYVYDQETGDVLTMSSHIYTSSDAGVTWVEQTTASSLLWFSIVSSADGSKLAAIGSDPADGNPEYYIVPNSYIYTSTDAGVTWTKQSASGLRPWTSLASSADGTRLAAIENAYDYTSFNGAIYTSIDSGATWKEQVTAGKRSWQTIASSTDGTRLAFAVGWYTGGVVGPIYLATMEGPATDTINLSSVSSTGTSTSSGSAVTRAKLSITSSTCYTIENSSVNSLGSGDLAVLEKDINLLGGIAYNITCATQGGSTDATITLGTYYSDPSKLRIYKKSTSSSLLVDITNQVSITNAIDASNAPITTLRYTLVDGGDYDEDGIVNGVIVDPLYIGVVETASAAGTLAETGSDMWTVALAGICVTVAGAWLTVKRTA
jgi:hypothetical protein